MFVFQICCVQNKKDCSREIFDPQIFEFPKTNSSKIVCQMCRFKQIIEVQTFFSLPTNKFVKKNLLIRINHKQAGAINKNLQIKIKTN